MEPKPSPSLFYLLSLLEEEFQGAEGVRVKAVFPSTTQRSIDLPQDYDPESNNVHSKSGVNVFTSRRVYFFPTEWIASKNLKAVDAQIAEIKNE